MRTIFTAGLLAALAAIPAAASAQGACGGYVKAPSVGGWSEYVVRVPGSSDLGVRFAVTEAEARRQKQLVWFETRVNGGAGTMVSRLLVPGYPYAASQDLLLRARGQELPRLHKSIAEGCEAAQLVGDEQITVRAGTFRTKHFRSAQAGADFWVSTEAPFGLVKMTNSLDNSTMELVDRGTGAKTSITGTPRMLNGPAN
jgi:hypothetical protein